MPELPEVETVCRLLRKSILGRKITGVQAAEDPLVFKGTSPDRLSMELVGAIVKHIGRKGKYFWITTDRPISLIVHFGMSGWAGPVQSGEPEPKFTKLILEFGPTSLAFWDGRRLGRIWLSADPLDDPQIKALGPDSLTELPTAKKLAEMLRKRKTAIKAVLLDQAAFAGIGNYLADEVLYQSRIAPAREAASLDDKEIAKLRSAIKKVIRKAVEVGADENRFPEDWLFHRRWGGKKGADKIGRRRIVRETIASRTTAWVPSVQK